MGYWISLSIFLYATGEFNKEGSKVIANFDWDAKIRYSWWFHLFALFYMTAIISAFASFIYSSSACIWYFTSERGIEAHPIIKSFKRGLLYHFGSIAFGSLIIAIVRLIMVWFEYIKKRVESTTNKKTESKCFKCIFSCLQCCVGCIGKIMEYVNRHAYIQIALKGDNFCTAAWEGFGREISECGILFEGNYFEGQKQKGKEYYNRKIIFDGEYKNNMRSEGTEYQDGNIIFKGKYLDGKKWNGEGRKRRKGR